ncbi:hypothetical protein MAM1_0085d04689 [Mucor ambiguus]|uniref:Transposase Tc1-like domain-containing protein n=1 Tax=Mucor ambiguus TaxID=91626 RepID=A0A0C9LUL2_9FUNG|nr:hypothetical protein MAM1_0085d04689 [Mucor ambiguus]
MDQNYTCRDRAYLRGLRDGGMPVKQIVEKTGVSSSGVGKRALRVQVKKDRRMTLAEIIKNCADQVSICVIRNALHEGKLFNRVAKKKPYLRIEHVCNPLALASEYKGWAVEDYET